jgi:hypothetical protein
MSKYIEPPKSDDCVWRKGPPPSTGWWPAGHGAFLYPTQLRWWDGSTWSCAVCDDADIKDAGRIGLVKTLIRNGDVLWTDRWWEKK